MPRPPAAPAAPAAAGRRARREPRAPRTVEVDVVVVGAGQAGLSTAYHLHRTGLAPVGTPGWERARGTFVVLDENPRAGGAWQHRPRTLSMADAHHVHDLPGMPLTIVHGAEPAADAVPYYFSQYEEAFGLNVQRPVRVTRVEREPADDGSAGDEPRFRVTTVLVDHPDEVVVWSARALVNASGTWGKPFWPAYPGRAAFRGRQRHVRDVRAAEDLADGHVVVVGGGTSAVQLLLQLAPLTSTTWVTRRPPVWRDVAPALDPADVPTPARGTATTSDRLPAGGGPRSGLPEETLRAAVARVEERVRAGLVPGSVVSVTGLPLTPATRAGIDAGVLRARPVFTRIVPDGVRWEGASVPSGTPDGPSGPAGAGALPGGGVEVGEWADGPDEVEARTIVWATGYRAALDHLAPLGLRAPGGGIVVDGTEVVAEPRVQLVGYGPSASTVGANRAGRDAARRLRRLLRW